MAAVVFSPPASSGGLHPAVVVNFPSFGSGGHLRPAAVVTSVRQRWLFFPRPAAVVTPLRQRWLLSPPASSGAYLWPTVVVIFVRQRWLPPIGQWCCPAVRLWFSTPTRPCWFPLHPASVVSSGGYTLTPPWRTVFQRRRQELTAARESDDVSPTLPRPPFDTIRHRPPSVLARCWTRCGAPSTRPRHCSSRSLDFPTRPCPPFNISRRPAVAVPTPAW